MSMVAVRSMAPGERSLPAELRVDRSRAGVMDRLMAGMHGLGDGDSVDLTDLPISSDLIDTSELVASPDYSTGLPWNTNSNGTVTSSSNPSISTSSTATDISALAKGINQTLAISQGGGVAANGAIYGSAANGAVASLGTSTLTANTLSSLLPLLLIGGAIMLLANVGKK